MYETVEELGRLQELLDASFGRASAHLLSIMEPERQLDARRLVDELPCPAVINVATTTARGEPRISAVDGHFLHGRWHFSTAPGAVKARHVAARPAVSVSYTPRDGYGVFCHGAATVLEGAEHDAMVEHLAVAYGSDTEDWRAVTCVRVDADWMTGFAMTAEDQVLIDEQQASLADDRFETNRPSA